MYREDGAGEPHFTRKMGPGGPNKGRPQNSMTPATIIIQQRKWLELFFCLVELYEMKYCTLNKDSSGCELCVCSNHAIKSSCKEQKV